MRQYLDQLTPAEIALIHLAFSIARDFDNARICLDAGLANCGVEYYEILDSARDKLPQNKVQA